VTNPFELPVLPDYSVAMNHSKSSHLGRRQFITALAGLGALAATPTWAADSIKRKGRIKQGVCQGVFGRLKLDFEGKCREAARLGALGIDLVGPDAFPMLKKYGLVATMVSGGSGINAGINDKKLHADIDRKLREAINAASAAGAPNVIVMAGGRKGITDEEGADNSVLFLNNIKALAEDKKVTLCIELLNSKVNHPGYMADSTAWGVKVCKRVNSPRVKLLYDIYHMQIMEGDVIRTIRENIQFIGHFHTAGNPGRHEFDDTQELNYVGICRAIADLKYDGYLSHEYSPIGDPLETLDKMMRICDV
jgi:hydroxypyruvate isomerase